MAMSNDGPRKTVLVVAQVWVGGGTVVDFQIANAWTSRRNWSPFAVCFPTPVVKR
eukprot:CAMPEP_0174311392 /NCGR_PEP_ID=MMETSP0810-20121108/3684_1 /TAXON_ID=73025 ORGANISM="Eutreptiella gymnastica-like, Strain CCMP1594" /NCGR_SAMPLE_ID=MMETSP0810 /ASSEMBLY_ACC=CAM_ASM_000659 /LENGTH=54 /DNA_ID=CAMNT_0015419619 /DNA_START=802 /DNA_END=967 /DNA_ORIENTATION=-